MVNEMIILWIVVIGVVVWLLLSGAGRRNGTWNVFSNRSSALDILKERYARGEIDKAEFEAKRRDIIDNQ